MQPMLLETAQKAQTLVSWQSLDLHPIKNKISLVCFFLLVRLKQGMHFKKKKLEKTTQECTNLQ